MNMCLIESFLQSLHQYLTGSKHVCGHIIRKHSKKLDELGDVSFPLKINNWVQVMHNTKHAQKNMRSVFDYMYPCCELNSQLQALLKESQSWCLKIENYKIRKDNDVHLYLNKAYAIELCLKEALKNPETYGLESKCFQNKIILESDISSSGSDPSQMSLTELRVIIIQQVISNIIKHLTPNNLNNVCTIKITQKSNEKQNVIVCGAVLTETGAKDMRTTASELNKKRALDMQLMAQHKYGIQIKPGSSWHNYFEKLGKASVIIEMLQNKTHKATKITLNNLQTAHKGPSFIFYNCARLSALFKEFDDRVSKGVYPVLPSIENIDFTLLIQPEEWEMVYVYILQFPVIMKSCVCEILTGVCNVHYLVLFLSNLSSIFSVYYRRVKVLTISKEHLLPILYARIYLLNAVQQIFHKSLYVLNIEPIKEM